MGVVRRFRPINGWIAAVLLARPVWAANGILGLGHVNGEGVASVAYDLSGDGSTVVGSNDNATHWGVPFRWTAAGGMTSLGGLGGSGGLNSAKATSFGGSVVTGTIASPGGNRAAFRWAPGAGIVGLGGLPGMVFATEGGGISGDGKTLVGGSYAPSMTAYRWTQANGTQSLGHLPGGSYSIASDASYDGSVIVGLDTTTIGWQAFRWTEATGMTALSELAGGGYFCQAATVTSDGRRIGGMSLGTGGYQAVVWTDGVLRSLGDLPGGDSYAMVRGISDDGSVVVGTGTTKSGSSGDTAFYWSDATGMVRLWDYLLSIGVDPAADGWTSLDAAAGLSVDGTRIAGTGTRDGHNEAFLVTIPEPTALAVLGVATALGLRRRRPAL